MESPKEQIADWHVSCPHSCSKQIALCTEQLHIPNISIFFKAFLLQERSPQLMLNSGPFLFELIAHCMPSDITTWPVLPRTHRTSLQLILTSRLSSPGEHLEEAHRARALLDALAHGRPARCALRLQRALCAHRGDGAAHRPFTADGDGGVG